MGYTGNKAACDCRVSDMAIIDNAIDQIDVTLPPLTPEFIEKMIGARQALQVVRFRSTCTDCVPNY